MYPGNWRSYKYNMTMYLKGKDLWCITSREDKIAAEFVDQPS